MPAVILEHPLAIEISGDAIAAFCQKWDLFKLELFGSVLRDDFRPDSDVDVLVTFGGRRCSLFDFMEMQDELQAIFGRDVDLLTRRSVELSTNQYRRKPILESARIIYEK